MEKAIENPAETMTVTKKPAEKEPTPTTTEETINTTTVPEKNGFVPKDTREAAT